MNQITKYTTRLWKGTIFMMLFDFKDISIKAARILTLRLFLCPYPS